MINDYLNGRETCVISATSDTIKQTSSSPAPFVLQPGLGPKYSVLRYFGTRVPIFQYSSVLSTRTFEKYRRLQLIKYVPCSQVECVCD